MKICETCGLQHPDDVQASHHPVRCRCGLAICGSCIWTRTITAPNLADARLQLLRLQAERLEAVK